MGGFGQTLPTLAGNAGAGGVPPEHQRDLFQPPVPPERMGEFYKALQQARERTGGDPPEWLVDNLITRYFGESMEQAWKGGQQAFGKGRTLDERLGGVSDIARGGMKFAAPFYLPGALMAAPLATLAGLGTGIVAGAGTEAAAQKLGLGPGASALAGDVVGLGAGGWTGRPENLEALGRGFDTIDLGSERGSISFKTKAPRVENAAGAQVRGTMGGAKGKTYVPLPEDVDALAAKLQPDNPEAGKRAATAVLKWRNWDKPYLEKKYGPLEAAPHTGTKLERMQNTSERVSQRIKDSRVALKEPTEPWKPKDFGIFDRELIKKAINGFPDVKQTEFPRTQPTRASLDHVDEIYNDPVNRELIKTQIARGLPLGGETFYPSLYPVKAEAIARNLKSPYFPQTGGELFDNWIHSVAPGSARNSILNERAVGNLLRSMKARGIPITKENVTAEMAAFKDRWGKGLPLMFDTHAAGAAKVLEQGISPLDVLHGNLTDSYKIPTYAAQQTGNFAHSWTGDVHEATGETLGSRFHPYFTEQGGFGVNEYGRAEKYMRDIAKEMGLPTGTAQAGRWFGGGELTGLMSPRGDSLDMLETQVAYTLHEMGKPTTPQAIRDYVMKLIQEGGDLLPWQRDEPMPDYRRKK